MKIRHPKPTVQLCLEVLEDRTVLSTTSVARFSVVASPPAAPQQLAAVTSLAASTFNQYAHLLETFQLDVFANAVVLSQEIAQAESYAVQQWGRLFGFQVDASNQVTAAPVQKPTSGSGSGSGSSTGHSTPPAATPSAHPPALRMTPKTAGSGVGTNSDPSSSYGNATVNGQVWLDNNGDNSLDNGEMGFKGIEVDLWNVTDPEDPVLVNYMTTNDNAQGINYQFQFAIPPNGGDYQIEVHIPSGDYADEGDESQIDSDGFSAVFPLAPGGSQAINAGLKSMNVTINQDDPGTPIKNQVTLRDAILTGDNGPPAPAVTFSPGVTGIIYLQTALAPITKSYNIFGPGSSALSVDGQSNAGTIFTVNAGVTSTISGLTIKGGAGANGGGINNSGKLTLNSDTIEGNQATGQGGGIWNSKGSLNLSGDKIVSNIAATGGGLYNAGGTVTITGSTLINGNTAKGQPGGGICNASGTVTAAGGTVINSNSTSASGGGVANSGTFLMTSGSISQNFMLPGPNYGGGVYNPGSMRLLGVQVQGNSAANGGGICTTGQLVMGKNTNISGNNKASSNGARVYVDGGTVSMIGGGVTNNTAQRDGGGIYVLTGELTLSSGASVIDNHAVGSDGGGDGGGIFISGGKVFVTGGTIGSNTSSNSGGGIYSFGGILTLKESVTIHENEANNKGGGIYLAAPFSATTFNTVLVSGNQTTGSQQTTGWGVYWQDDATVLQLINLTDDDDPGGKPVQGP